MSNNNSNDLFSKIFGTTLASTNQAQVQSGESTSTTEPASTQSDKGANNAVSSSQDQKQTYGSSVSHSVFNPIVTSTSPTSKKKSVDVKKVSEKINIKLVAGIAIALVVVIVLSYVGFGVVLPAKTNASKIRRDFLGSEITSIYESNIEGNGLREKIFLDSLTNYPKDVKKAYIDDKIAYDRAISIFSTLKSSGLFDEARIIENREIVETLEVSKRAFTTGEQLFAQGKFNDAIVQFAKVVEDDKNYDKAQDYITQCGAKYKDTVLSSATNALSSGNYDDAVQMLEEASQVLTNDSDISSALEKAKTDYAAYLKKDALEKGNALISEKKYQEAISLANTALEKNANDSELTALLNLAESEYVSSVISQADSLMAEYDYSRAVDIVDEALQVLPDNAELKNKRSIIDANKPVPLDTLVMLNSHEWKWNEGVPKDPFNNDYSDSANYVISTGWYPDTYGEFRAYKKYKRLTGRIAPYTGIGEDDEMFIKIFADDELVYTSPIVTRKTDAFRFNVDVKNAEYIKIVFDHAPSQYDNTILSDLVLYTK